MTMTTTAQSPSTSLKGPDDPCGVCDTTRENHGDMRHKFSLEGHLEVMPEPAPPRAEAPKLKGETMSPEAQKVAQDPTAHVILRLVELMVEKELLSGDELMYILGGKPRASN